MVVALLGANGAGKTSILKTISGILAPSKGSIQLQGQRVEGSSPENIVRAGVAHAPEGREIFPLLTVHENLRLGAYIRSDAEVSQDMEAAYNYFPQLRERTQSLAGELSGGQQQMLSIARALMIRPKLLLLDEPSLGLSPRLTGDIFSIITRINRERNTTILLVEQNAQQALSRSDRAYILETGTIVREGVSKELLSDDSIRAAYLGVA